MDAWQGKGAGRLLLGRLAAWAMSAGIRRFRAVMDAANEPALRLMRRFGGKLSRDAGGQIASEIALDGRFPAGALAPRAISAQVEPQRST
jgi:GNAT superfamily N-acetyltransferase